MTGWKYATPDGMSLVVCLQLFVANLILFLLTVGL